jgi:hypothetical protein
MANGESIGLVVGVRDRLASVVSGSVVGNCHLGILDREVAK